MGMKASQRDRGQRSGCLLCVSTRVYAHMNFSEHRGMLLIIKKWWQKRSDDAVMRTVLS